MKKLILLLGLIASTATAQLIISPPPIASVGGGGGDALVSDPLSQFAPTSSAQLATVMTDETGSGVLVYNNGPTFIAPVLGTPASGNGSNLTALNASNLSTGTVPTARLGTGTADATTVLAGNNTWITNPTGDALTTNPLSQFAATTSSQFKGVISDENAPDGASSKVIMALGSLSIASAKTFTASNTLTLAGTDATTMTFPTTSATIARTDAAQTFTGTQTFGAVVGTTWNGNTWATGTGTLSIAAAKTLTASNTLTLAGTDGTTMTFPTTSATVARTDAANTFTGHQTIEGVTSTGATGTGKFVFDTSPTLVTPLLGTPTSGTLTNCTGLPVAGITASTSTALGVGSIELGAASDTTVARDSAGVVSVEGVVVPTISSTSTLTNKRVTPRTGTTADTGSLTIDSDATDFYTVTALAQALTINAPSGTPTIGQKLMIRFKDNGTARALTFATGSSGQFRASSDLALPTTTTLSKTLYTLFVWNGVDSRWDLLAKLDNF